MAEHDWLPSENYMHPPPDSVVAGHDSDGVVIYVARAYHRGELLPAKFMPDKSYCAVPYGGEEVSKKELEVLRGHGYIWEPASHGHVPEHAVIGGRTAEGEPLFIGRGHWHGSLTPGKVHPSHGCLYIPYGHGEHRIDNYEVLVRPHIESWVRAYGSEIVPGTIHAGHDADGDPIYVGRAYHAGDLLPAKVIPNKQCAYVCHGGREIHMTEYELLVGHNYGWSPSSHGNVPPKAVVCGKTSDGEPLYIGRGHYQGSLTPGKVHCSHGCLYIPFGGDEVRLDHYEVLVRT